MLTRRRGTATAAAVACLLLRPQRRLPAARIRLAP
jgi:hypothetical protein